MKCGLHMFCFSIENKEKGRHTLIIGKCDSKLMKAGEAIQQNTNLAVVTYTSLDQVEGWEEQKWNQVFQDAQV